MAFILSNNMDDNRYLEDAATYLLFFAGLLFGASLLGLTLAIIKIGLDLMGITNPL